MIQKEVEIINKKGLHARAASKLVQTASKYKARVTLSRDGQVSDGKSILGVLILAAHQGSMLKIEIDGVDEAQAMEAVCELISHKFDEGE